MILRIGAGTIYPVAYSLVTTQQRIVCELKKRF